MGFDKDEMAMFTWTFEATSFDTVINFNASYVGAPSGVYVEKTVEVDSVESTQSATSTKWSEKARRVGILISGIPNPMETKPEGGDGKGKFGIGLINPLDRPVEIVSLGIVSPVVKMFEGPVTGVEPTSGWRTETTLGQFSILLWEASKTPPCNCPVIVAPGDVAQFRVEKDFREEKSILESPVFVEVLTSEGKLFAIYTITAKKDGGPSNDGTPTISSFYTSDVSDPLNNDNWGYAMNNIQSGQQVQYNVTVSNSSKDPQDDLRLLARIVLIILLPKDFTNVNAGTQSGWNATSIVTNPDGSTFLKVNTTSTVLGEDSYITFSFNATAPVVTENSLYVFQTTTFYPNWSQGPEIASSVSEAGVVVRP